jgi:hypothetical protein
MEAIVSPNPFFRTGTISGNGMTRMARTRETRKSERKECNLSHEVRIIMTIIPARMRHRPRRRDISDKN